MATRPVTGSIEPDGFDESLAKLAAQKPVGAAMNTADWQGVGQDIKDRAMWSAGVESVKFLDETQRLLLAFLRNQTNTTPDGAKTITVGGRGEFVRRMIEFVEANSIPRKGDGSIQDIGSGRRLGLIFDTKIRMAQDYGYWKEGNTRAVLDAYPFQRFIRIIKVRKPRPVHEANIGVVRRKDDIEFWLAMNSPSFGGFGVPYGPWGYNSGCSTEDVAYDSKAGAGLLQPWERVQSPEARWNDMMRQTVKGVGTQFLEALQKQFPDTMKTQGDSIVFQKPASKAGKPSATTIAPKGVHPAGSPPVLPGGPATQGGLFWPESITHVAPVAYRNNVPIYKDMKTGREYYAQLTTKEGGERHVAASKAMQAAGVPALDAAMFASATAFIVLMPALAAGASFQDFARSGIPESVTRLEQQADAFFLVDVLFGNWQMEWHSFVNITNERLLRTGRGTLGDGMGRDGGGFLETAVLDLDYAQRRNISLSVGYRRQPFPDAELRMQLAGLLNRKADILRALPEAIAQVVEKRLESLVKALEE